MFVKDVMSFEPLTVGPNDPLDNVAEIMRENHFEVLPVVEKKQVVGVITAWDFLRRSLEDVDHQGCCVSDVMSTSVITVSSDEIVEEAAFQMRKHDVWALPVLNDHNQLVGMINQIDLFRVMVDMMGLRSRGSRITLRVPDKQGILADITQIVKASGVSIASLSTYIPERTHIGNVVLRVKTEEPRELVLKLRDAGFWVTHVSQVWE